ncbi:NAD(P)H-hydrate dehydratase [Mesobacterium pallidum]|uniref:NAD(P)H-hydrate dehydratase n=1 Tax=Mesobacterium pallidum TaxID=2872037 RepID=UPI001EE32545|nr:NAD(P)H-hydrate dehydratase [Mesobacterium pallidum]
MAELLGASEMRAVETAAIESGSVSGATLMERAGQGVVDAILAATTGWTAAARRAIVLCGPGNNGGDGFVIARLLAGGGWDVEVALLGDPARLPADARANHDRWNGQVVPLPFTNKPRLGDGQGVLVDALFGTGLGRGLGAEIAGVLMTFDQVDYHDWMRVAVDLPSGLCSDSGRVLTDAQGRGPAFRADLTVSFHAMKRGHVLAEGPHHCGAVQVVDIGLGAWCRAAGPEVLHEVQAADMGFALKQAGHKYDHGHALVLSGPPGRGGAARLAARAALRVGAGLVTLAAPLRAVGEHAARLDAIMLLGLDGPPGLSELLEDGRITAICLGPGLGLGPATAELARVALQSGRAVVLDADALSRFNRQPQALFDLTVGRDAVLTPHDGEFRRLFPDLAAGLSDPPVSGPAFSRVDAARAAAERAGCTVLLKGPDTVIAAPDGAVAVNAAVYGRAAPWLATAGAGDVLAGLIAGLLARGNPTFAAAAAGAWLHVEAARAFGPGLIAEDIPEALPSVFRSLMA